MSTTDVSPTEVAELQAIARAAQALRDVDDREIWCESEQHTRSICIARRQLIAALAASPTYARRLDGTEPINGWIVDSHNRARRRQEKVTDASQ